MAKRQREWARRKRDELREAMGGKCAECGSTTELTFDCVNPQGPDHHSKMDWSWRMSFYRAQLKQGNLQLLCNMCNSTKRDRRPF